MTKLHHLLHPYYEFRDAGTGRFVTRTYALLHPLTTYSTRRSRFGK